MKAIGKGTLLVLAAILVLSGCDGQNLEEISMAQGGGDIEWQSPVESSAAGTSDEEVSLEAEDFAGGGSSSQSAVESSASLQEESSTPQSASAVLPEARIKRREPDIEDGQYLLGRERSVLALINARREARGLPALEYAQPIRIAARILVGEEHKEDSYRAEWTTVLEEDIVLPTGGQALVMARHDFSGQDPSRESWTASQYFEALQEADGYSSLMDKRYTHIGVGILTYADGAELHEYVAVIVVYP